MGELAVRAGQRDPGGDDANPGRLVARVDVHDVEIGRNAGELQGRDPRIRTLERQASVLETQVAAIQDQLVAIRQEITELRSTPVRTGPGSYSTAP